MCRKNAKKVPIKRIGLITEARIQSRRLLLNDLVRLTEENLVFEI
jgi:hypothetical protein